MERYTIYCTPEQTKKALELGASITLFWEDIKENYNDAPYCEISPRENELGIICDYAVIPTAEQMIGWIEEQEKIDSIEIQHYYDDEWESDVYLVNSGYIKHNGFSSRKEATLAAIDEALDYLIKNKK